MLDTVYDQRKYVVTSVIQAKEIAMGLIDMWDISEQLDFGLPEVDDRYHVWRVPILAMQEKLGEVVVKAQTGAIDSKQSTSRSSIIARLEICGAKDVDVGSRTERHGRTGKQVVAPVMRNTILLGNSEEMLNQLPASSVQLMFTSPPYYNARPQYSDYRVYDDYLHGVRSVMREVYRVLEDGRFAVINCSPVLIRRSKRSESSKRIAVPFDIHQIMVSEGYEFIDDIIWEKPSGAGWATGRGRRFAADRNPLQYKAVPVTEYVLVYRKKTDKLIDWHIRNHPNKAVVKNSKIADGYEVTNIWKISPARCKHHPAIFPAELAEKVIRYYSFEEDVVLDPYAGIGTVGKAATNLNRKFVLSECNPEYVDVIRGSANEWLGTDADDVQCINCAPISVDGVSRSLFAQVDGSREAAN